MDEVKVAGRNSNIELRVQEKYVHLALNATADDLSVIIMESSCNLKNKWKKCGLSDLISILF